MTSEVDVSNALVLLQQQQQATRVVNIGKAIKDIKGSKFFAENWNDMLLAAPNCLALLGTCASVACSDAAAGIEISRPLSGKFTYLDYTTLKGCLAQVSNQGQTSFENADRGMAEIASKCENVKMFVERIVKALISIDAPVQSLMLHMNDLKTTATECKDTATGIYKSFDLWQNIAKELWAACNNESSIVEKRQRELDEKLAFANTLHNEQSKVATAYETAVTEMNERVNEFKEEYKQQLAEFPGAWTLLGQQIALGLTEAVGTATVVGTSVAAQSYAAAVNPMGTAAQLAGAAKGFQGQNQPVVIINGSQPTPTPATPATSATDPTVDTNPPLEPESVPVKDPAAAKKAGEEKESLLSKLRDKFTFKSGSAKVDSASGSGETSTNPKSTNSGDKTASDPGQDSTTTSDNKPASDPKNTSAPKTGKENAVAKDEAKWPACNGKFYPTDPAFSAIDVIATYVDGVRALIVNANDQIQVKWEDIIPPDAAKDQTASGSKAKTLEMQLERKQKTFKPDAKGLASQLVTRILAESHAVVSELVQEGAKSKSLGEWKKPDADSPLVQDWEGRITQCSEAATIIKQSANSTPGVTPGGMTSLFPQRTDAEVQASSNLRTNLAQETIKAATTKLTSAQDVYKSTLNTYKEMRTKQTELQNELARAKAEIEQLDVQKVTEANVRQVLVQCISFLGELKIKMMKLVEFFTSISVFVNKLYDGQIKPFDAQLNSIIQMYPDNPMMYMRYNAYLRDIIFQMVLQIRAQFDLFNDITSMYREVHAKCIIPGLERVGECSVPAAKSMKQMSDTEKDEYNKVLEKRRENLKTFNQTAEKTIHDIVKKKQDQIINSIERKVQEIGANIEAFPIELRPNSTKLAAITAGAEIAKTTQIEQAACEPSAIKGVTSGNGEANFDYVDSDDDNDEKA